MRRVLTNAILLYWTTFFVALGATCTLHLEHGIVAAYRLLGLTHITSAVADAGAGWLTGAFGVAFGLIGLAFLWALVASLLDESRAGEAEETMRLAFASGAIALAVLLLSAAAMSVSGVFPAIAIQLGAMAASYLAAFAERDTVAVGLIEDQEADQPLSNSVRAELENALHRSRGRSPEPEGGV